MRSIFLLPAASLTLVAADTDWPQFRGPTGQGLSAAKDVPVEWDASKNVAWKVEVPGSGWSSPVLAGGRIYLTSAVGEAGSEATLHALCFDGKDGRLVWDTEVFRAGAGRTSAMHRKNSLASPTPIVTGNRLFVHFGHMGTAALDLAGKVVWRQESLNYPPVHGNGGSPILVDGLLVFNCDAARDPFVAALDAASGAVRWKTPRNTPAKKPFSFATPLAVTVGGATQVISPGSGFVGSYDPKTGAEKWRVSYGEGYSVIPRPVFAHGLLFVSSSFDRPVAKAIRPDGAEGDATSSHVAWEAVKGGPHTASMIVAGDELYYVSDAGIATCADARTGKVHWAERIPGNYSASPFAAEGRVYFQNETGIGTVVRAAREFQNLATNSLGEATLASPAPVDGALFIRSEKHLWRIGK
jgi:outer membrane protein assembly factor BamB